MALHIINTVATGAPSPGSCVPPLAGGGGAPWAKPNHHKVQLVDSWWLVHPLNPCRSALYSSIPAIGSPQVQPTKKKYTWSKPHKTGGGRWGEWAWGTAVWIHIRYQGVWANECRWPIWLMKIFHYLVGNSTHNQSVPTGEPNMGSNYNYYYKRG